MASMAPAMTWAAVSPSGGSLSSSWSSGTPTSRSVAGASVACAASLASTTTMPRRSSRSSSIGTSDPANVLRKVASLAATRLSVRRRSASAIASGSPGITTQSR